VLPEREPPPVPEISIDEDGELEPPKYNVRPTGKILRMLRKVEAESSEATSHDQLWRSILPLDPGH
jgi:hypothetical protein